MLKGLKVLEFQGLAPSVFCAMYFADQGAQVILVARPEAASFSVSIEKNILNRNKKCIALSLKDKNDREILVDLIKNTDIVIDPYRPGILQKIKLGPKQLSQINKNVILLRVTGYGQTGPMALRPGHDLNYISTSGVLYHMNQDKNNLQFPSNFMADFVGSSLGISGTLTALKNRQKSKHGYVVDCSLTQGCAYLTNLVKENQESTNSQKISDVTYFQKNQKRFIITHLQDKSNISLAQIQNLVTGMTKQNKDYFKNSQIQIAQIKKNNRIKQSTLQNPFKLDEQLKVNNLIPKKDEHRQEIINYLNLIKNSKL